MNPILYSKEETAFTTMGLGLLSDAISCTVTEVRNGEFELELQYPIDGANYGNIEKDRIIVARAKENGTKQAFRIYRITELISGQILVNARHISYQLNFIPVPALSGTGTAQDMMDALSAAALETCPFTLHSDIASSADYNIPPTSLRSALGGMEGSALDTFGGEFEWDNWTVNLLASRGSDKGVKIEYAKNMTDFSRVTDMGSLITGVMAYWSGENESGNTVRVYSNPAVITNGHESEYAFSRTIPLDVSAEFETQPTQAQVTAYARSYLAATELAQVTEAITVDFVPLWQTKEYEHIYREHIDLCDTVTVTYQKLGISIKRKVTKTVYNVLLDRYEAIELGGEADIADTISELQSGESYLGQEVAKLLTEFRTSNNFATFSSVTQIGLTSGSATIADAMAAMREKSILIAPAVEFAVSQRPTQLGTVLIVKVDSASTRGWIQFYGKDRIVGDYRMGLATDGGPSGTWTGADDLVTVVTSTASRTVSINAGAGINVINNGYVTEPAVPAGYTELLHWGGANGASQVVTVALGSYWVQNTSSSNARTVTCYAKKLCIKNSF